MQEWHLINPLYVPNETKLMINSNLNKNQISERILFLFSNEGSCELSAFDFCSAMKAHASL